MIICSHHWQDDQFGFQESMKLYREVFSVHPQARLIEMTASTVEPGDYNGMRVEPGEDVVRLNVEVWVPRAYFVMTSLPMIELQEPEA